MDYDVDIYLLSSKFMADYPSDVFPEIMHKPGRPYTCLMIDLHEDYMNEITDFQHFHISITL